MMYAEDDSWRSLRQIDERLKVAAGLGVLVAVALRDGDDRIDDDEADLSEIGADGDKVVHVTRRIEAARSAVLFDAADERRPERGRRRRR